MMSYSRQDPDQPSRLTVLHALMPPIFFQLLNELTILPQCRFPETKASFK